MIKVPTSHEIIMAEREMRWEWRRATRVFVQNLPDPVIEMLYDSDEDVLSKRLRAYMEDIILKSNLSGLLLDLLEDYKIEYDRLANMITTLAMRNINPISKDEEE